MEALWFWLVGSMLIMYTILDGLDLGAGALHLLLARTPVERRLVLRTIGPVWDGNEVWLVAAGGTLFFAFPGLYPASKHCQHKPPRPSLTFSALFAVKSFYRGGRKGNPRRSRRRVDCSKGFTRYPG